MAQKNPFKEMNESQIVKRIMKMLKNDYPGSVWYKIHGGRYQEAGIPDIVGCYAGRFYAFEVKRPERRSRVSPQQRYQITRLKSAGAVVGVVVSAAEVKELIDNAKKEA